MLDLILLQIKRLSPSENKLAADVETGGNEKEFDPSLAHIVSRLAAVSKSLVLFPLHAACQDIDKPVTARFPCACVITLLIDCGIDVNTKDAVGMLPNEAAVHLQKWMLFSALIDFL